MMEVQDPTFSWIEFPEGRARFSGSVRGADEAGHDTFAVEREGQVHYGEIRRSFFANGNDFNLEIVSFGWPGVEWIGMEMPGACQAFSARELEIVQSLVARLVEAGTGMSDKPNFLLEYPDAGFQGKVVFRDGWALVDNNGLS